MDKISLRNGGHHRRVPLCSWPLIESSQDLNIIIITTSKVKVTNSSPSHMNMRGHHNTTINPYNNFVIIMLTRSMLTFNNNYV